MPRRQFAHRAIQREGGGKITGFEIERETGEVDGARKLRIIGKERLWPRSIVQPPLTPEDEKALAAIVRREERRPEENVKVTFE